MMPMKIDGYDLRILLSDIIHDGKMWVFDPLHSQVDNLRRDALSMKRIGQPEETHREEIDPDKLIDGPIVIA
jgi:hypothetical protein